MYFNVQVLKFEKKMGKKIYYLKINMFFNFFFKHHGKSRIEAITALTVVEHNMGYSEADVMARLGQNNKSH